MHGDEEEHQHPAVLALEAQGRVLLLWDSCGDLVVWEMLTNLAGVGWGGGWGEVGVKTWFCWVLETPFSGRTLETCFVVVVVCFLWGRGLEIVVFFGVGVWVFRRHVS